MHIYDQGPSWGARLNPLTLTQTKGPCRTSGLQPDARPHLGPCGSVQTDATSATGFLFLFVCCWFLQRQWSWHRVTAFLVRGHTTHRWCTAWLHSQSPCTYDLCSGIEVVTVSAHSVFEKSKFFLVTGFFLV